MFGILLLMFELRTEKTDRMLRVNFGFMYGNKTRTIFLMLYVPNALISLRRSDHCDSTACVPHLASPFGLCPWATSG